jgi:hypothetical protein
MAGLTAMGLLLALATGCSTTVPVKATITSPVATASAPVAPEPPRFDIPRTSSPVTIDGKLDDPIWQQAVPVAVNYRFDSVGVLDPAQVMQARFAWDEQYLYIGYQVWDSQLVALSDGREKGPKGNRRLAVQPWAPEQKVDCVEFFISFGDLRFMWEVQHNAANHLNEVFEIAIDPAWPIAQSSLNFLGLLMNDEQYIRDDEAATVKTAVHLLPRADGRPSTVNDASDVDTGYTGELRLPWSGLGAPKAARAAAKKQGQPGWDMAGRELLLLAVILNGNEGWTYHHSSPTKPPKGMMAAAASHFPRGVLQPAPPAEPAASAH